MSYSPEVSSSEKEHFTQISVVQQRIDYVRNLVNFEGNLIEEVLARYGHADEGGGPEEKLRKAESLITKDLLMADFYQSGGSLSRWGRFWTTNYGPIDIDKYKVISIDSNYAFAVLAKILDIKIIYSRSAIIQRYLYEFSTKNQEPPIIIMPSSLTINQEPPYSGIYISSIEATNDPYCGESGYVTIYKSPFHNLGHRPPPFIRKFGNQP